MRGPSAKSARRNINLRKSRSVAPGSRLARACRHRAQNRAAGRALGRDTRGSSGRRGSSRARRGTRARCRIIPIHNVKQRSFLRSRRALLRPGFLFSFPSTPIRGERSAERRSISVVARCGARPPCLARRGARPAGRARLSALHRGDFGPGAALPSPAFRIRRASSSQPGRSAWLSLIHI